jgi:hypothetical protein
MPTLETDAQGGEQSAVIIVIVIYCYTYYVYIARLCVPLIQQRSDAQGSFTQGGKLLPLMTTTVKLISTRFIYFKVIYVVLYHVLFVWFCWSYIVITNTEPGYAIDVSLGVRFNEVRSESQIQLHNRSFLNQNPHLRTVISSSSIRYPRLHLRLLLARERMIPSELGRQKMIR